MRSRAVFAIALLLLLLPAVSSAQRLRLPRIGRGAPTPAELPPQPPTVARELAYRRLPYSVESYPLVSRFESSASVVQGGVSSWTSAGMGTHIDYRVARRVSATVDLTSSFIGGPTRTETVELGARLRPERFDRRLYPFLDVRVGYVHAYDTYFRAMDFMSSYLPPVPAGPGARYSQGIGAVGGAGMEYALTRRIFLTSTASVMRTHMTTYGIRGASPSTLSYRLMSYRYTLGLKFNPVRPIYPPGTDMPAAAAPER